MFNWSGLATLALAVPRDDTPPAAVTNLTASPGAGHGEVLLSWTAPGDDGASGRAARYRLRTSAAPLDESSWDAADSLAIALAPDSAGSAQRFTVSGLAPGQPRWFALRAVDEAGHSGPVSGSPSAIPPERRLTVWAAPAWYKLNPLNGNAFEYDPGSYGASGAPAPYRTLNRVWDAAAGRVRLAAGRNEFAGFQLVVERAGADSLREVDLVLSELVGPATLPAGLARLYREWYHRLNGAMYPDLLVPFHAAGGEFKVRPFAVPDPQLTTFAGLEQRNQALFIDLYVPRWAPPGSYRGTIRLLVEGQVARELELVVEVRDFTLPEAIHYGVEFNCYGDIGPGWKLAHTTETAARHDSLERVVHRALHEHRIHLDRMPYSHNPAGQASFRCAPTLSTGAGAALAVSDWSDYDRRFGPLFDGSAFAGNPRDRQPVAFYYLPFHTEWPVRMPVPRGPAVFTDRQYIEGWTRIVTEFERHLEEKGWTRTTFFCYQNEKEQFGYQPWDLDEPTRPQDYEAINFFAGMFHRGRTGRGLARLAYRCDMGHFSYLKGELDQAVDSWVINRGDYPESTVRRQLAQGDFAWTYGAAPRIDQSLAGNCAVHFWTFRRGARGYCYWDTFSAWGGDAWNANDPGETNLFYPGMAGERDMVGHTVCPSLRMKAIREAAEMMEGLELLGRGLRWSAAMAEELAGRYDTGRLEDYLEAESVLKQRLDGLTADPFQRELGPGVSADYSGDGTVSPQDVLSLLLMARERPDSPLLDWDRDGRWSIRDALSLLLEIRRGDCPGCGGSALTAAEAPLAGRLSAAEVNYLEELLPRLGLSSQDLRLLTAALHGEPQRPALPQVFALEQNHPNPFNPSTTIGYSIPEGQRVLVRLEIYNLRGMLVRRLVEGEREAGRHSVAWDGRDARGRALASGVYLCRLRAGGFSATRKLVLLK